MKSASHRSVQTAALLCCVPSHRSTPRRQPHTPTGPTVQKPTQGTKLNSPKGYTGVRVGRNTYVLRREDMGEGMAPATTGAQKRLRTAHFEGTISATEEPPQEAATKPNSGRHPRKPLPMKVQPHPWQARI